MTLTRIVGKGRSVTMPAGALEELRDRSARAIVDLGTGDGHYAYAVADEHPDWLVIGIDALAEPMEEIAHKAGRKPVKGGRANVMFVRAAAEALPEELHGVADEVHVMLPWGRLLEGIVVPDDDIVRGLATLAPVIKIVLNGEIWDASLPARFEHLPVPTPEYVAMTIAPGFARAGVELGPARYLPAEEAKELPTTWARRLAHGRPHPKFVAFEGTAVER